MYGRMLIPLDGSKTAEKVLPYARPIAGSLKIPIELMRVIDISEMTSQISPGKARFLDTIAEDEARSGRSYLEKIAHRFPGVRVQCTVEKGKPAEVIIEKAAANKDTMIAMATHGRSGLDRWLLGSVAEKVLRGSSNPLLLVRTHEKARGDGEATLKRVIVPLDGSELAEYVLPAVVELAKIMNLEVLLIRVFDIPATMYGGEGRYAIDYDAIRKQFRFEAHAYLEKKAEELRRLGLDKVSLVCPKGYSADEILILGQQNPDSFIAMCTHGRSGVTRWALGSVTENVVRHSGNPVLVIRAGNASAYSAPAHGAT
jgi:nucleotide-binding universal stress UspA family protein